MFVGDSLRADVLGARRVGIRSILLSETPPPEFQGERAGALAEIPPMLIDGKLGP